MRDVGTVERAFQLAKSETCHDVDEIRRQLEKEGYPPVPQHLSGPTIKKQLSAVMPPRT
ncbi:MAG: hypothetical protein NVS3B5_14260 [Sphingomicrobium sp.]